MDINLPIVLEFGDEYAISWLFGEMKKILPDLKVDNIGTCYGKHYAIFYTNKCSEYSRLFNETKKGIGEILRLEVK